MGISFSYHVTGATAHTARSSRMLRGEETHKGTTEDSECTGKGISFLHSAGHCDVPGLDVNQQ